MFGPKKTIRVIRQRLGAAVAWAAIPLVVSAGVPSASCACVKCECGSQCGGILQTAETSAAAKSETPADGCCCCCRAKQSVANQRTGNPTGKACLRTPNHQCRIAISTATGIKAAPNGDKDLPLAADVAATPVSIGLTPPQFLVAEFANTGPPVDLVVALQRLLI
jgi:hypothetical protein